MGDPDKNLPTPGEPWPGLDPKKDEVTFNVDTLGKILGVLQKDLERLNRPGPGTLNDVLGKIAMPMDPFYDVDWPAGEEFFRAVKRGSDYIGWTYSEVVRKYQLALTLVNNATINNGSTEIGNKTTVGNV